MLYSTTVTNKKQVSFEVPSLLDLKLSQIVLGEGYAKNSGNVFLNITYSDPISDSDVTVPIACLNGQNENVKLDLIIDSEEKIIFTVTGANATVHVVGNFIFDEEGMDPEMMEMGSDDEDDEDDYDDINNSNISIEEIVEDEPKVEKKVEKKEAEKPASIAGKRKNLPSPPPQENGKKVKVEEDKKAAKPETPKKQNQNQNNNQKKPQTPPPKGKPQTPKKK